MAVGPYFLRVKVPERHMAVSIVDDQGRYVQRIMHRNLVDEKSKCLVEEMLDSLEKVKSDA